MGRRKIKIEPISDDRHRQATFLKRKVGIFKKACELSVMCDCEIALIIFTPHNRLIQYASSDMDKLLLRYTESRAPVESRNNDDFNDFMKRREENGNDDSDEEIGFDSPTAEFPEQELGNTPGPSRIDKNDKRITGKSPSYVPNQEFNPLMMPNNMAYVGNYAMTMGQQMDPALYNAVLQGQFFPLSNPVTLRPNENTQSVADTDAVNFDSLFWAGNNGNNGFATFDNSPFLQHPIPPQINFQNITDSTKDSNYSLYPTEQETLTVSKTPRIIANPTLRTQINTNAPQQVQSSISPLFKRGLVIDDNTVHSPTKKRV